MEDEDYFSEDRCVKELTPDDFESVGILKKVDGETVTGMVMFYAPWCGYCKALKDNWSEAAKTSGFCDFFAFNCEKNKNYLTMIKDKYPDLVNGYPSIIKYKNGTPVGKHEGNRDVKTLLTICMENCQDGNCKRK